MNPYPIITGALLLLAAALFIVPSIHAVNGQMFANAKSEDSGSADVIPLANLLPLFDLKTGTAEDVVASIRSLTTGYADAVKTIEELKSLAHGLPKGITAEALQAKIAAGLDKARALEVLLAQAAHDKTKPHDKAPAAKD
jgi:hypothetical protein